MRQILECVEAPFTIDKTIEEGEKEKQASKMVYCLCSQGQCAQFPLL